jgi:L-rhamnose isomerase/sugar isomerase
LRAYVQASLVDRDELRMAQNQSDVMLGHKIIKRAFLTDVTPVLAEARRRKGGAIDPWTVFRSSNYRALKSKERPFVGGTAAGIV